MEVRGEYPHLGQIQLPDSACITRALTNGRDPSACAGYYNLGENVFNGTYSESECPSGYEMVSCETDVNPHPIGHIVQGVNQNGGPLMTQYLSRYRE